MISAWFAAKGLFGLKNGIWLLIVAVIAAACFTVIRIADNAVEDTLDTAKDAGAADAVIQGQNQTFDQLGDANDAEENIRRGGECNADRYAQCLLDNRRPENCERYNPDAGQ